MLLAFVLASALPLLWPDVPPLARPARPYGPLPGPARPRRTRPTLQQYYGFQWALIGNLGVDLLVELLAPLIGLEPAVKLIVLADPAADRRRAALGRLRGARPGPADRPVRAALRLQLPLPVRLRRISRWRWRWRSIAFALWLQAGAAGPAAAARRPVRADLGAPLGRPRLRLGNAGRARFLGRAGPPARPRPQFHLRPASAPAFHCLALAPPVALMLLWRSDGGGQTARLVQLGAQAGLADHGAARPLGVVRHGVAGARRALILLCGAGRAGG